MSNPSHIDINTTSSEQPAPLPPDQEGDSFLISHPWIRHYEQGVPTHLIIPEQPLPWILDEAARRYPDHTACLYYGARLTYSQLAHYARRFARALRDLGVNKGDRVALALPNIPQYPIAFYGVLLAGAVVVPTNPLYTRRELQHQLADAGARLIIMLDASYHDVRAIRTQTALESIILTSPADFLPPMQRAIYLLQQRRTPRSGPTHEELRHDPTILHMHALLQTPPTDSGASVEEMVALKSEDLAALQYTGGTTGLSKGAMLTHRNLLANALQTRAWFPQAHEGGEVMLCVAPFFHAYGLTVCMNLSVLLGASMVLLPRFKAKEVVNAIRRYHPTILPGIPTMYLAILREAGQHTHDLSSIKYCISGGAPLPAQIRADFESATHGKLVEGYGLSEASPVTHANPLDKGSRQGSIGLPFPEVEARIVDQDTGETLPPGEVGELLVKGPNIMRGYWNHEAETQAVFRDGWLRTGDLGRMDADGYFSIVERAKDVIIASGFKVYPREVEEVLFGHPAVSEAVVVGVPDAYRGETVAAFIVLKPGVEASERTRQELISYCQQALTAYKVPKIVEFRQSLPKSWIGKALRRELRAEVEHRAQ